MNYVSLYRKYRPTGWDKVIGQDHIVRSLINQITTGELSHAYLFTGSRGTGKTSSAKIFARAVNCQTPKNGSACLKCAACVALENPSALDIVEMDAASNNGVEEIRELKENVRYLPTAGKYKVYIIDEVHMLSTSAFNALLKTLEEPPAHVIFVLCTTEAHKLPKTILSRCMRFDFRLVAKDVLHQFLNGIFETEGYAYDTKATELIAIHGEGSVRDALSLADMCRAYAPEKLTYEACLEVLGSSGFKTLYDLSCALIKGNTGAALQIASTVAERGKSVNILNRELTDFFNKLLFVKNISGYNAGLNDEQLDAVTTLVYDADNYRILRILDILCNVENQLRYATQQQIIFNACLTKASELITDPSIEALTSRVKMLENELNTLKNQGFSTMHNSQCSMHNDGIILKNTNTIHDSRFTIHEKAENCQPSTANSIEAMLAQFGKPVEASSDVFEAKSENEEYNSDSLAASIFGTLLTKLREKGQTSLYLALRDEEAFTLNNKVLSLNPSNRATALTLSDAKNAKILDTLLKEAMGFEYEFAFKNYEKENEQQQNDLLALTGLFGEKLKK
jgi:DNA polymerase-3 subunit gamma/tau